MLPLQVPGVEEVVRSADGLWVACVVAESFAKDDYIAEKGLEECRAFGRHMIDSLVPGIGR